MADFVPVQNSLTDSEGSSGGGWKQGKPRWRARLNGGKHGWKRSAAKRGSTPGFLARGLIQADSDCAEQEQRDHRVECEDSPSPPEHQHVRQQAEDDRNSPLSTTGKEQEREH